MVQRATGTTCAARTKRAANSSAPAAARSAARRWTCWNWPNSWWNSTRASWRSCRWTSTCSRISTGRGASARTSRASARSRSWPSSCAAKTMRRWTPCTTRSTSAARPHAWTPRACTAPRNGANACLATKATPHWRRSSTNYPAPTASTCGSWCATRWPSARRTSRRAPSASCTAKSAPCSTASPKPLERTTPPPPTDPRASGPGAADGDAVDQQRGLADADRNALAVLAADADAVIERHVMPDHAHLLHGLRPVADQRRPLHRRGHLAILDQIGLGGREHVFAAGDIDLSTAEIDRVQALLHRADHVGRVVLPRQHVGIGHARHHQVRERFAATVAGRRHAHQPRVERVLHIAHEHAVLDQGGALRGRALVVDVERAAALVERAVIDDGHAWRRHALAHAPGVGAGALAVEVALQAMADRFVQQHAGPAAAEHHRHHAGRGV